MGHAHDVVSSFTPDQLAKARPVRLDPEVAGEGLKAEMITEGDVSWMPPPEKLVIPDFSQIKSIRRYFGRVGHQPYPAWFYHPTEKPRLMNDAQQALDELDIFYRRATDEEERRYGIKAVWDTRNNSQWSATPYAKNSPSKFDPRNPGQGKTYLPEPANPAIAQHQLVQDLIPQVAAAVAQALKSTGPAAPAHIDPKDWDEFVAFQAWKKSQEVIVAEAEAAMEPLPETAGLVEPVAGEVPEGNALQQMSSDAERSIWEDAARDHGIEIKPDWTLQELKAAVEKAAAKAA